MIFLRDSQNARPTPPSLSLHNGEAVVDHLLCYDNTKFWVFKVNLILKMSEVRVQVFFLKKYAVCRYASQFRNKTSSNNSPLFVHFPKAMELSQQQKIWKLWGARPPTDE